MKISLDLTADSLSKLDHLKTLFRKTRTAFIREAINDLFAKYVLDESYRKAAEAMHQPVVSEAFANPQETEWFREFGVRVYQTIAIRNKRGTAMFDGSNWIPGMLGTFGSVELPDLLENWQEHGINTEFYNMIMRNQQTSLNN